MDMFGDKSYSNVPSAFGVHTDNIKVSTILYCHFSNYSNINMVPCDFHDKPDDQDTNQRKQRRSNSDPSRKSCDHNQRPGDLRERLNQGALERGSKRYDNDDRHKREP